MAYARESRRSTFRPTAGGLPRRPLLHSSHNSSVDLSVDLDADFSGDGRILRLASVALAGALGVAALLVLWETSALGGPGGGLAVFAAGLAVSAMLGLAAAMLTAYWIRTRRLTWNLSVALQNCRLATDTLASLDVVYSRCLPSGERDRFSDAFLRLLGCEDFELSGRSWLDFVHPEDRDSIIAMAAEPMRQWHVRDHVFCVRSRRGQYIWLHETFSPRVDAHGNLVDFICTAFDITRFVETETRLAAQINQLSSEAAGAKARLETIIADTSMEKALREQSERERSKAQEELRTLRKQLKQTEADRSKYEVVAAQLRESQEEMEKRMQQAEAASAADRATIDELRKETAGAVRENKTLARALQTLESELDQSRKEADTLRKQLGQQKDEAEQARAQATAALQNEAQLRAENDRLAKGHSQLEKKLADIEAAVHSAQTRAGRTDAKVASHQAELSSSSAAVEHASSSRHSKKSNSAPREPAAPPAEQAADQWSGAVQATNELVAGAIDEPLHDAARKAAASIRAVNEFARPQFDDTFAGQPRNEAVDVRDMPRMPQEFLTCNLGNVIALGGDSIRVMCNRAHKSGEFDISFDQVDLTLRADVAWCSKVANRKYEVGFRFLNITPELRQHIVRIAMEHRKIETLGGA